MVSKVKIKMNICENATVVGASIAEDGTFKLTVSSPCEKAVKYVEGLGQLTLSDLLDKTSSKVFSHFLLSPMSANCLLPAGVLSAAWLEAGLIAPSAARNSAPNGIEFVFD